MHPLRRYTLHRWNSRHNPLTRVALIFTLLAVCTAALGAMWEYKELRVVSARNQQALSEMFMFLDGKVKMVEVHGKYAVEYRVETNTFEVMK